MEYEFLEDVAIADVAYRVYGKTLEELFKNAARAVFEVMVETQKVAAKKTWLVELENKDVERLLYDFLSELIALKDEEAVVFGEFDVDIKETGGVYHVRAEVYGDQIDPEKYELRTDVKAVTMHMFGVKKFGEGYRATVVLDV